MKTDEFIRSIYLGDRACKTIINDRQNNRVLIQIDLISRIRDKSGEWNFYSEEDIANGFIVFTDVESMGFDPSEMMPNDYIEIQRVSPILKEEGTIEKYLFEFSMGAVDNNGNTHEVLVKIIAGGVHLEDPMCPGIEIKE